MYRIILVVSSRIPVGAVSVPSSSRLYLLVVIAPPFITVPWLFEWRTDRKREEETCLDANKALNKVKPDRTSMWHSIKGGLPSSLIANRLEALC